MVANGLARLASALTRSTMTMMSSAPFHTPASAVVLRYVPDFDPLEYSTEGSGRITRKAAKKRSLTFEAVRPRDVVVRPGASLYIQDPVLPSSYTTATSLRPYSHSNKDMKVTSDVDLYGEDFVEGAWIP
eukprot:m.25967 g.25967  ORF g.25967 m.25967 type:complete len:130 (-) comp4280_c0_seq2:273-662(-)